MYKLISFIFIIGFIVCSFTLATMIAIVMNILRNFVGKKSKSKCINDYIRRR